MEDFLEREGHIAIQPLVYKSERLKHKFARMQEKMTDAVYIEAVKKMLREKNGIVTFDLTQVVESDAIIAYLPRDVKTYGTLGEITIAYYLQAFEGKKIDILIVTNHEPMDYPIWVLGCSDKIFHTFGDLKEYIRKAYKDRKSSNNERKKEMEEEFEGETSRNVTD